jgi:ADP-heptose:LPS heptosyltransferase
MADPPGIVVFAPNWLGDAVMALPSIEDVKRQFPSAHLTIAARGSVASLFELARFVDDVLTLEWRGRLLGRQGLYADAARLRELGADVAILLPNSFASAWLARRAQIPERWGYSSDLRRPFLTRAVRKPKTSMHQGRYYQHLAQQLGAPNGPLEPMLDVPATDVDVPGAAEAERMERHTAARGHGSRSGVWTGQTVAAQPLRAIGDRPRGWCSARAGSHLCPRRQHR